MWMLKKCKVRWHEWQQICWAAEGNRVQGLSCSYLSFHFSQKERRMTVSHQAQADKLRHALVFHRKKWSHSFQVAWDHAQLLLTVSPGLWKVYCCWLRSGNICKALCFQHLLSKSTESDRIHQTAIHQTTYRKIISCGTHMAFYSTAPQAPVWNLLLFFCL